MLECLGRFAEAHPGSGLPAPCLKVQRRLMRLIPSRLFEGTARHWYEKGDLWRGKIEARGLSGVYALQKDWRGGRLSASINWCKNEAWLRRAGQDSPLVEPPSCSARLKSET